MEHPRQHRNDLTEALSTRLCQHSIPPILSLLILAHVIDNHAFLSPAGFSVPSVLQALTFSWAYIAMQSWGANAASLARRDSVALGISKAVIRVLVCVVIGILQYLFSSTWRWVTLVTTTAYSAHAVWLRVREWQSSRRAHSIPQAAIWWVVIRGFALGVAVVLPTPDRRLHCHGYDSIPADYAISLMLLSVLSAPRRSIVSDAASCCLLGCAIVINHDKYMSIID